MTEFKIIREVEVPEGIQVILDDNLLKLKGSKGETERNFRNPLIKLIAKDKKILLSSERFTKREKKLVGTFEAHIKNMIQGANEGHTYKLKICSSHFPMNVTLNNNEITVKNFLGEKSPRKLKIKPGCDVKIDGVDIIINSLNKEIAGQVAAGIESLTRVTNKDRRVFQDGIFIVEKSGKRLI